jgi:hypothetical protein
VIVSPKSKLLPAAWFTSFSQPNLVPPPCLRARGRTRPLGVVLSLRRIRAFAKAKWALKQKTMFAVRHNRSVQRKQRDLHHKSRVSAVDLMARINRSVARAQIFKDNVVERCRKHNDKIYLVAARLMLVKQEKQEKLQTRLQFAYQRRMKHLQRISIAACISTIRRYFVVRRAAIAIAERSKSIERVLFYRMRQAYIVRIENIQNIRFKALNANKVSYFFNRFLCLSCVNVCLQEALVKISKQRILTNNVLRTKLLTRRILEKQINARTRRGKLLRLVAERAASRWKEHYVCMRRRMVDLALKTCAFQCRNFNRALAEDRRCHHLMRVVETARQYGSDAVMENRIVVRCRMFLDIN